MKTKKEAAADWKKMCKAWLNDHPGKTAADFEHEGTCGATEAERTAWEQWVLRYIMAQK